MGQLAAIFPDPGIVREGTRYTAENRWYDSQWIRWRKGLPESMGGWVDTDRKYLGVGRRLHDWGTVAGNNYLAIGTTYKLYVDDDGTITDITPERPTVALGTDPITTANGTGKITINITGHEAVVGDYVTLSGATATNGIPVGDLNKEHRISGIVDADNVEVVVATAATSTGTGGGSAIEATPQINVGLDTFVSGGGWGAGSWGSGSWGGSTALDPASQLRLWSLDNFGDDLVSNVRTGGLFYWDESAGLGQRAVAFKDLTRRTVTLANNPLNTTSGSAIIQVYDVNHGAGVGDTITVSGAAATNGIPAAEINAEHQITGVITDSIYEITVTTTASSTGAGGGSNVQVVYTAGEFWTPTAALQIMTSPTARHIIAFGANEAGESDINPLLVRWCNSERPAEWRPTDFNTAGDLPISTGSKFIGALRTRQEIIIWTDVGLNSMRYVGFPTVFTITEIESGPSLISPNAAVYAGGRVFFMDRGGFYIYAGGVQRLPCSVRDYLFSDLDLSNAFKIQAGANQDFSEVLWLYPSVDGNGELDSYVKYNYDENLWDIGRLVRGAWANAPTKTEPRATTIRKSLLGDNPVTAVSASSQITVAAPNHGLGVGDEVIIQGCGSVGGIDADVINTQWPVAGVPTDDTFTIDLPDAATSNEVGGGALVELIKPNDTVAHEVGWSANGEPLESFVESGSVDIADGEQFQFISRFIPDLEFRGTDDPMVAVNVQMKAQDFPGEALKTRVNVDVMPTTKQKHVRFRARQMVMRIGAIATEHGWRAGKFRFNIRTDGRR